MYYDIPKEEDKTMEKQILLYFESSYDMYTYENTSFDTTHNQKDPQPKLFMTVIHLMQHAIHPQK